MKRLTLENRHELQPYIALADYNEYNSNIVTMLMWSSMYEVRFEVFEHFALVYTKMPNRASIWMMPYCEKSYRKEALIKMQEYSKKYSIAFEIHSMTLEFKNWLQEHYPYDFLIWDCYNARDYVYDRKQQESLVGKKMQKRRNHFHAFEKEFEGRYQYKALTEEDIPHIYAFLERWKALKEQDDSITAEEQGIHLLLSNLNELPIQGGCIYIDGQLEAFNITSRLSHDTIQIHVEKANRSMRGLYIAILKLFLETVDEDVLYLNREDDMGLEKLRKAKRDMQPVFTIRKMGCCHQKLILRKAEMKDMDAIKQLWMSRFDEETEETSTYFFTKMFHLQDCYVLYSEEELICMMQTRFIKVMLHQTEETIPFLYGVATNEEYEGCSYMKLLMNHVLEELKKEYRFAFIQAHNWDLYRSFGFHEMYEKAVTKIDKAAYSLGDGVLDYQYSTKELLSTYQSYVQHVNGWRIRDEAYYDEQLPYKRLWNENVLVHRLQDEVDAYGIYTESEGELHVVECIYKSQEALHNMLALLSQTDKKVYVHTDLNTELIGRRKQKLCMMVKELQDAKFPSSSLFINEDN